ncbi:MAG: methyltransferase domain-containing protein [Chitinispirillaceae bacterium]|jgi:ubiquinone/menaquinone biosynthesis C-methylase UbiE
MNALNEHEKLNQKYFDKWAGNFEENGFAFKYFQKRVISEIELKPGLDFLDIGCGTGWAVRYVAALLNYQGNFVGLDLSEQMINRANEIAKGLKNVIFYNGSSDNLPFAKNAFDNIICTFSFHHYLKPEMALSEVERVLKRKGRFFILDGSPDDLITKWIEKGLAKIQKEHVKQYSSKEIEQMFIKANLKYIKSKTIVIYPVKLHIAEKF